MTKPEFGATKKTTATVLEEVREALQFTRIYAHLKKKKHFVLSLSLANRLLHCVDDGWLALLNTTLFIREGFKKKKQRKV